MELKGGGGPPPPGQQTKMSGTISPRDRLQLWVNIFLLKQKENSGSVTATFRDFWGCLKPLDFGGDPRVVLEPIRQGTRMRC